MKKIGVVVTKYKTNDGKIHDTSEKADHHEKMQSGIRKECPTCNRKGEGGGTLDEVIVYVSCDTCSGRGWPRA